MTCARCRKLLRAKAWRRGDESPICAVCIAKAAEALDLDREVIAARIHQCHAMSTVPGCWYCDHQVAA